MTSLDEFVPDGTGSSSEEAMRGSRCRKGGSVSAGRVAQLDRGGGSVGAGILASSAIVRFTLFFQDRCAIMSWLNFEAQREVVQHGSEPADEAKCQ